MNTLTLVLAATLTAAVPLALAALGGIFSEGSGVINIGLEGIMLMAAFAAALGSWATGSAMGGVALALAVGALIAALHGLVSVKYRANQVISGVAINILALGLTDFLANKFWGAGQSPAVAAVPHLRLPFLQGIPVLSAFSDLTPFVYLMLILVPLASWVLYQTPFGLRLRAVGEKPAAADTVGVSVSRMRYLGVILSGVLAGLAGASLSVGLVSGYTTNMTAGRGFIALAAVVFGNWRPAGALAAALLFGLADAAQVVLQLSGFSAIVPGQFLQMLPYLLTIFALTGLVGRTRPPAASGIPYEKGER